MAKLLSWDELPQSIKDFDANISKNLSNCESKANELSVMVNDILVLLKDADTTLKEDFKDDPQCVDAEKKMFLIYTAFQRVKTSIDNDLISGIIGMGKEVKSTIDDIRSKISEGAGWKEASEEEDSEGNKIVVENDQAKIDAANIYINKLADCAVEEISAIKNAQSSVKLGISLETLKLGELGKYTNYSTTFSKSGFLNNYEGISRVVEDDRELDDSVVELSEDTEEDVEEDEGIIAKLRKLINSVIDRAKEAAGSIFGSSDSTDEDSKTSFTDWITDAAIISTFPELSGITQVYNAVVDDSKEINFTKEVKKVAGKLIETIKENNFFEFAKEFWGGAISKVKSVGSDVVETVEDYIDDTSLSSITNTVSTVANDVVDKVTTLGSDILNGLSTISQSGSWKENVVQALSNELLNVDGESLLSGDDTLIDLLTTNN